MNSSLAIKGGQPICSSGDWPIWPQFSKKILTDFEKVLGSKRWTISSFYTDQETFDEKFCKSFADYNKTKYVLTTDHGSSAILLALQALEVKKGHEVIIPGLTWVACATAVLRANAVPILVDIEASTQCICPKAVEKAITPRTKAILVVHLYSCMANMDELLLISHKYKIPLIEDCSQSHGALWKDKKAGSMGTMGIFSMQQGKILTSGEGGAIITNNKSLYDKIYLLKNDGRKAGKLFLEEDGRVIGANFALSEFQCALLCDGLEVLEEQNLLRERNANYLSELLQEIPGIINLEPYPQNTQRSYYHFCVRYSKEFWHEKNMDKICDALTSELGTWIHPSYNPLTRHQLFQPKNDIRYEFLNLPDYSRIHLKECEEQAEKSILIHHSVFLAQREKMEKIYEAFKKVQKLSDEL